MVVGHNKGGTSMKEWEREGKEEGKKERDIEINMRLNQVGFKFAEKMEENGVKGSGCGDETTRKQ